MKDKNIKITPEEKRYYSFMKMFDRLAPFYDFFTLPILGLRNKAASFADAKKGSKILDVCTGTGAQAFAFARKGYDVVGIDLSKEMLEIAKKKNKRYGYSNMGFKAADATKLPFEDNRFDVSCVSFALHDMIPSIREKVVNEMARVTKPGGIVVVVDYGLPKNRVVRFLAYNFIRLWEKYYPEFIKSDLEAMLRESGIEVKEEISVLLGAGRIVKGVKVEG